MIALLGRLKWKIAAVVIVLVGAVALGWKVNGWRNDATQLDTLRAEVEQTRQELVAAEGRAAVEREEARNLSLKLWQVRRERDTALEELDARPTLTRTVTEVLREDCPVCTCDALGSEFRGLWNGASGGTPDPEAPTAGRGDATLQ